MRQILIYILIGALLLALQATLMRFFSIESVIPDIVVIWLVYVSLREGQIAGSIAGFFAGLILDFVSGDFLGLSALTKSLCGFFAGYFYDEFKTSQTFGTYRFFFAVLLSSLLHNVVYFGVYLFGTEISMLRLFIQFGLGTSAYTAALSIIPVLWKQK